MQGLDRKRAARARRAAGFVACGLAIMTGAAGAQGPAAYFSSSSISLAGGESGGRVVVTPPQSQQQVNLYAEPVRPFSQLGLTAEMGTLGLGVQLVTPLSRTLHVRGGADFLNFGYGLTLDGAQYEAEAHLRSGHVNVDWYPFGGTFRISPGVLVFGSAFGASVSVPGGNSFELGKTAYTSSSTDPVHGSAAIAMQHEIMPALTVGWGNLLGDGGKHWSIPFEVGAAYTGHYTFNLNLAGTACSQGVCMSTATPQVHESVVQEEGELNETMKRYQIYPIVGTGVSFRF